MLRVWGVPRARPTMDIDLLRRGKADQAALVDFVTRCTAVVDAGDAVKFDAGTIVAEPITEDADYAGTRIRLVARMGNLRQTVQIDFGVGDAVVPGPVMIEYPLLLGGEPLRLNAYPVEAAIAEKYHAMVVRDLANSRMKDFYDVWFLSKLFAFDGRTLCEAVGNTFKRRSTPIPDGLPLAFTDDFREDVQKQAQWRAFVRRSRFESESGLDEIVAQVRGFASAPLSATAREESFDLKWRPGGPWE